MAVFLLRCKLNRTLLRVKRKVGGMQCEILRQRSELRARRHGDWKIVFPEYFMDKNMIKMPGSAVEKKSNQNILTRRLATSEQCTSV
jgi:hypothetical protein